MDILSWLKAGNKITSLEAWIKFGCSALHSRCADLRKMGVELKDEWISVETVYGVKRVKRYWVD